MMSSASTAGSSRAFFPATRKRADSLPTPFELIGELRGIYDDEDVHDIKARFKAALMAANALACIVLGVLSIETAFLPGLHRYDDGADGTWPAVENLKTILFVLSLVMLAQLVDYKWYCHTSDISRENALANVAQLMEEHADTKILYWPFWRNPWTYVEVFCACAHATPNFITRMHVELNLVIFLRSWFIFQCGYQFSDMYRRRHAVRRLVAKTSKFQTMSELGLTHVESAYSHRTIVRALFKERPWHVLAFLSMTSYLICSYCIFVRERKAQWEDFGSFPDALWFTAVTMTTVGYGGQEPQDDIGRFFAMVACVCGIIVVSLAVVVMVNDLQFTELEQSSIRVVNRLKAARKIQSFARKVEEYGDTGRDAGESQGFLTETSHDIGDQESDSD